jgi:hypothetical protein
MTDQAIRPAWRCLLIGVDRKWPAEVKPARLSAYGTAAVGREVDVRRSEHIGETGRAADAFSDSETACALACEPSGNIHSE